MAQLPKVTMPEMRHMMWLTSSVARLLLAALLGGIVGLERTIHRKPAGIRTTMFICMGAAMFTIMSDVIPDPTVGDRTRIASNIVQGVGFLGAGAILHSKGGVSGLTTAATIWVVASIGIAAGAGHYLLSTFSTVIILIALNVLGYVEAKFGLKNVTMSYEIKGKSAPEILEDLNEIVQESHHAMQDLQVGRAQDVSRVFFNLTCTVPQHQKLQAQMKMHPEFESVTTFNAVTEE
jgi:putative Mg2+ transporter-C (MgtC) family protein